MFSVVSNLLVFTVRAPRPRGRAPASPPPWRPSSRRMRPPRPPVSYPFPIIPRSTQGNWSYEKGLILISPTTTILIHFSCIWKNVYIFEIKSLKKKIILFRLCLIFKTTFRSNRKWDSCKYINKQWNGNYLIKTFLFASLVFRLTSYYYFLFHLLCRVRKLVSAFQRENIKEEARLAAKVTFFIS